jgi:hypothetical protein
VRLYSNGGEWKLRKLSFVVIAARLVRLIWSKLSVIVRVYGKVKEEHLDEHLCEPCILFSKYAINHYICTVHSNPPKLLHPSI